MKVRKSIITAATGVLLAAFSGMAIASVSPQANPAATKQTSAKAHRKSGAMSVTRGTITSIDNNRVVISRHKNGKAEEKTFALNSQTARKGDLVVGSLVSVHYRTENNQNVATALQAMPKKTASIAPKPISKK
jgi:hypothetical protein